MYTFLADNVILEKVDNSIMWFVSFSFTEILLDHLFLCLYLTKTLFNSSISKFEDMYPNFITNKSFLSTQLGKLTCLIYIASGLG